MSQTESGPRQGQIKLTCLLVRFSLLSGGGRSGCLLDGGRGVGGLLGEKKRKVRIRSHEQAERQKWKEVRTAALGVSSCYNVSREGKNRRTGTDDLWSLSGRGSGGLWLGLSDGLDGGSGGLWLVRHYGVTM